VYYGGPSIRGEERLCWLHPPQFTHSSGQGWGLGVKLSPARSSEERKRVFGILPAVNEVVIKQRGMMLDEDIHDRVGRDRSCCLNWPSDFCGGGSGWCDGGVQHNSSIMREGGTRSKHLILFPRKIALAPLNLANKKNAYEVGGLYKDWRPVTVPYTKRTTGT